MTARTAAAEPTAADLALAYAAVGWCVFPVAPGRKAPLFRTCHPHGDPLRGRCRGECGQLGHGLYDATADPETITTWWSWSTRAGVGIRTGAASGLLVVDVDPRHNGDETLTRLEREHTPLLTLRSRTGGGGEHLFFLDPGGPVVGTLGPGVEVKHEGGYVIAPPSRHPSGRRYAWSRAGSRRPGPVPVWLEALLRPAPPPARPEPAARPVAASANGAPGGYVRAVLERELAAMAEAVSPNRRQAVCRVAFKLGQLAHLGADQEQVARAILAEVERLGWGNLDKTAGRIADAWQLGATRPRWPRPAP
jgi:Bifunctional DNA primase/polymerase, N-terminal